MPCDIDHFLAEYWDSVRQTQWLRETWRFVRIGVGIYAICVVVLPLLFVLFVLAVLVFSR